MIDQELIAKPTTTIAAPQPMETLLPAWRRQFAIFWDFFLVVAFGAGLYDAARADGLWNARGFWLILLALAFLTAHRWLWAPIRRGDGTWPPAYRDLLLALVVELVLVIAMLPSSAWFAWPLLAMMGQVAATLPPNRWKLPFAGILLVLAGPIGLYDALALRQWGQTAGLAAAAAWLIAIFLYIRLYFDEREARLTIERNLESVQQELNHARPLLNRIDDLHSRERALGELRDGIQHTLAFLHLRLEALQQRLPDEPATVAAELAELRQMVQQRLSHVAHWPAQPAPITEPRSDAPPEAEPAAHAAPDNDTSEPEAEPAAHAAPDNDTPATATQANDTPDNDTSEPEAEPAAHAKPANDTPAPDSDSNVSITKPQ